MLGTLGYSDFPKYRPKLHAPPSAFNWKIRVRHDDTDMLQHTNVSSYLKFALESAAQASSLGVFSSISDDVAFYRPRRVASVFVGESRAGDELTVATWQETENANMTLNFLISNRQNPVYCAQIEFYCRSTTE